MRKDVEWRIWNPQSNFYLPSRTQKAVITLSTTLKLIYTGHYSKRPGCSLVDLHPGFLFCLKKICRALTALHNYPFFPCSFRTLQEAWDFSTSWCTSGLMHQSSEKKKKTTQYRECTEQLTQLRAHFQIMLLSTWKLFFERDFWWEIREGVEVFENVSLEVMKIQNGTPGLQVFITSPTRLLGISDLIFSSSWKSFYDAVWPISILRTSPLSCLLQPQEWPWPCCLPCNRYINRTAYITEILSLPTRLTPFT